MHLHLWLREKNIEGDIEREEEKTKMSYVFFSLFSVKKIHVHVQLVQEITILLCMKSVEK